MACREPSLVVEALMCQLHQRMVFLRYNIWFLLALLPVVCVSPLRGASPEQDLMLAVQAGDLPGVEAALREGAWIDWHDLDAKSTPLLAAIKREDLAMVNKLLITGGTPMFSAVDGRTPLQVAVEVGNLKVVQRLLDAGAFARAPDDEGRSLARVATESRRFAIAALLFDRGVADVSERDVYGNTLPMMAANAIHERFRYQEQEVIALATAMEKRGLPWNAENTERVTLADTAAAFQLPSVLAWADRDNRYRELRGVMGVPPLELHVAQAVENNDAPALNALLASGKPDWKKAREIAGHDVAARAVELGRDALAIRLIQAGAPLDGTTRHGEGMFALAARNGAHRVVYAILARGGKPDQPDGGGGTALHGACVAGDLPLVQRLVERHEANVNALAADGLTPLMATVFSGNEVLLRFLLDKGAIRTPRNAASQSAADLAAQRREIGLLRLLVEGDEYKELLAQFQPRPELPLIGIWSVGPGEDQMRLVLEKDGSGEIRAPISGGRQLFWQPGKNFDATAYVRGRSGMEAFQVNYVMVKNQLELRDAAGGLVTMSRAYDTGRQQAILPVEQKADAAFRAWLEAGENPDGPAFAGLGMREIPPMLFQYPSIVKLDISRNALVSIPESINQLNRLQTLNASRNDIANLPAGLARLSTLAELDLRSNRIAYLPEDISGWTGMRECLLDDNLLRTLPEGLSRLSRLRTLSFRGNRIGRLPDGIRALRGLQKLDARDNQLTQLPAGLSALPELAEVFLQSNHFTDFPAAVCDLPNVQMVNLRNNRIHIVPSSISRMRRLELLDLSWNRLMVLPPELAKMRHLRAIDLTGNPLPIETVEALQKALPKTVIGFHLQRKPDAITTEPGKAPPNEVIVVREGS